MLKAGKTGFVRWAKESIISTLSLSNQEFKELQDFIYKKSGMFFPISRKNYIEQKISRRIEAMRLNSFAEYLNILRKELLRTEIIKLFNEITVNETFFFRDMPQLKALKDQIIPQLQSNASVRILSAGCSSGEEAYTLSIILREYFPGFSFYILGIDISEQVVAKAVKAHYSDYAVRFVPQTIKEKYFTHQDSSSWVYKDEGKKGVEFRKLNLMELDTQPSAYRFDIIFCRYVLIYFDLDSKKKVVNDLYNILNKGGHLFMGNSESLYSVTEDFDMMHFPSAIVYKKKEK